MRRLAFHYAPPVRYLSLILPLSIACSPGWAPASTATPEILVEAETDALIAGWISSSDTASLLSGVDSAQAGGVSGLPMIHGLGDDRIRILVNGVPVAAACPMHMNPPLSYIDPSDVARIEILPGVTPARLGGDSIAGTIQVESAPLNFAVADDSVERAGQLSTFYRSNSSAYGAIAAASMAGKNFSLSYQGSATRALCGRYAYYDHIRHEMNGNAPDRYSPSPAGRRQIIRYRHHLELLSYSGRPPGSQSGLKSESASQRIGTSKDWMDSVMCPKSMCSISSVT